MRKDKSLPPRMHKKGNAYYFVARNKWTPLGSDLNQARIKWAAIENEYSGNADNFAIALDNYLANVFQTGSPNTVAAYMSKAKLLKQVFGHMQLIDIKPMHIAKFVDSHPSKSAARMAKAIISATYALAIRQGNAELNPCLGIEVRGIKPRDRYITDQEFISIREHATPQLRIAMDVAYLTGMRISDVLKIRLTDITEDGLVVKQTKTGKRQIFEISEGLKSVIDYAKSIDRPIGSFYLIPNYQGQQYQRRVFYFQWQNACKKSGVENVHFHDIRGKAATDAKALGLDYQLLLGHATRKQSDEYIKARMVDRVKPLGSLLSKKAG